MTPQQFWLSISKKIKKEWIICFFSVIIIGLITHIYKLTNTLPNWDSLNNVYSDQNTIHLGRCFLILACGISSFYDLPWLNGVLSLCYLGITAVIVCEIFNIKKISVLILTGGLLVTFPTATSTFAYMYTADGYFLAMLCMTLSVYLVLRFNKGWISGIFLLAFGYGCYQAYITWVILLILIWSIIQLLFTDLSARALLCQWKNCALCGILGTLLYWVCNKALLKIQQIALASNHGIDEIGITSFRPLTSIRQCLIDFAYFFIGPLSRMNLYSYLNIVILVLIAILSIYIMIRKKLYINPLRFFLLIFSFFMLPFAAFAIYFISPATNYHMLMMMGLCLLYILLLLFYEKMEDTPYTYIRQWIILLLTALTIYNFILTANICYQTMQRSYDKSYAFILRLADRIEQTPGASDCSYITVLGRLPNSSDISLNIPPDMTGIIDGYIMSTPVHFQAMLSQYCDLHYELLNKEEQTRLLETSLIRNIPVWPQEGCIKIVDNVLVIQIGS